MYEDMSERNCRKSDEAFISSMNANISKATQGNCLGRQSADVNACVLFDDGLCGKTNNNLKLIWLCFNLICS